MAAKTIRLAVTVEKLMYVVRRVNPETGEVLCYNDVVEATRKKRSHRDGIKRFAKGTVAIIEVPNNENLHNMLLEQGVQALRDAGVSVHKTRRGNYIVKNCIVLGDV